MAPSTRSNRSARNAKAAAPKAQQAHQISSKHQDQGPSKARCVAILLCIVLLAAIASTWFFESATLVGTIIISLTTSLISRLIPAHIKLASVGHIDSTVLDQMCPLHNYMLRHDPDAIDFYFYLGVDRPLTTEGSHHSFNNKVVLALLDKIGASPASVHDVSKPAYWTEECLAALQPTIISGKLSGTELPLRCQSSNFKGHEEEAILALQVANTLVDNFKTYNQFHRMLLDVYNAADHLRQQRKWLDGQQRSRGSRASQDGMDSATMYYAAERRFQGEAERFEAIRAKVMSRVTERCKNHL
ncbi:hypothetical protein LIA77_11994 [Sarocladium implicatum]|nr:hypothetical protein LIA77_11994 [Sarocladium implicatum]